MEGGRRAPRCPMKRPKWDDAAHDLAIKYFQEGHSFGIITQNLYRDGYTFSRNAVIGHLHRAGYRTTAGIHPSTGKLPPKPKAISKPRMAAKSLPKPPQPLPKPPKETLIEYQGPIDAFPPHGFCQYTRDDVAKAGWQMCGHPVRKIGSPWCADHASMCFTVDHYKKKYAA